MTSWKLVSAALVVALLVLAAPAFPQAEPGPLPPKPGVQPEEVPPTPLKRSIHVQVSEVTAPVTVLDPSGEMVLNLTKNDFRIFDNGAEQKIEHFGLGGDPLSIVLVVETSSHIEALLPAVRNTGIIFAQTVMAQTGEAAVIGYDDTVDLLQRFTEDPERLEKVIEGLRMGTSGSRLYDALARGISLLENQSRDRRRILVVVGEALDTGSENKLGEVLRQAQLANVTIYSIGLSTTMAELRAKPSQAQGPQIGPPGTYPVPTPNGYPQTPDLERQMTGNADLLQAVLWLVRTGKNAVTPNSLAIASKATGGLHVNTRRDRSIEKAMDEIGGELHAQYTLGYQPHGDEPSGFHEIKVMVERPDVTVRTRPGYYLAPPES